MGSIAPNLSAIVGSAVAAKLMGTAGGLSALAKMPECNVQVLGHKRKNLAGFSSATSQFRVGYLEQTEIFQSTPPALKSRAGRILAAKSTLAARVDATRGDPSGTNGKPLREEIRKKIEKWQEPPPARLKERNYAGGATTSGLTSSLSFTPVQGIELWIPQQALGY